MEWVVLSALLGLALWYYGHIRRLYRGIASWQLTIWTIHIAPVVSLRLVLQPLPDRSTSWVAPVAVAAWLGLALAVRRSRHFCGLSMTLLELAFALVPLGKPLLGACPV